MLVEKDTLNCETVRWSVFALFNQYTIVRVSSSLLSSWEEEGFIFGRSAASVQELLVFLYQQEAYGGVVINLKCALIVRN